MTNCKTWSNIKNDHETKKRRRAKHKMKILLKNIEAERGRLGMTKIEMCEALGVTTKTYNLWLKTGNAPARKLLKLKEMTGKSVDYLLDTDAAI